MIAIESCDLSYDTDCRTNGKEGEAELPVPATFVIDTDGVVRNSHVDVDYTRRLDPDDVVLAIKNIKE